MSYDKNYLSRFKGQKVIFKKVTSFPDLKIQFVDSFGDYKVKITDSKAFAAETVKIQEVTSFSDVKLQKVILRYSLNKIVPVTSVRRRRGSYFLQSVVFCGAFVF